MMSTLPHPGRIVRNVDGLATADRDPRMAVVVPGVEVQERVHPRLAASDCTAARRLQTLRECQQLKLYRENRQDGGEDRYSD